MSSYFRSHSRGPRVKIRDIPDGYREWLMSMVGYELDDTEYEESLEIMQHEYFHYLEKEKRL